MKYKCILFSPGYLKAQLRIHHKIPTDGPYAS